MAYLLVGFLALWGITFAYLYVMARRQSRLERELELLRGEIAARGDRSEE
ncbi:MAG: CcmD family protein [Anaerolineae bacterium]|nr:CcmD family protein [Anaerolineae bacterium]